MSLKSREIRYPKIYSGIRNGAALPIGSPSSTLFLLAFFFYKNEKVHFRNRRILLEPQHLIALNFLKKLEKIFASRDRVADIGSLAGR